MAFQDRQLGIALGWKYNHTPGIITVDGMLAAFPVSLGPTPDDATQAQIVSDYQIYLASTQCKDDQAQGELQQMKAVRAVVNVLVSKGVCTLADVKAAYRALP